MTFRQSESVQRVCGVIRTNRAGFVMQDRQIPFLFSIF
jgi:hypothetical protein